MCYNTCIEQTQPINYKYVWTKGNGRKKRIGRESALSIWINCFKKEQEGKEILGLVSRVQSPLHPKVSGKLKRVNVSLINFCRGPEMPL